MSTISTEQALDVLAILDPTKIELLGLDGFLVRQNGLEAKIDLILDFTTSSAPATTNEERFSEAKRFVMNHGSPQVLWEIVTQPLESP